MAASTGKTGRGITFALSDGQSPSIYLTVANVTSINFTGRDAEEIDFTHLGSTGGFREFRQGFKDGGSIGIEYHFTPTEESHLDLLTAWLSGATLDWNINYFGAGWSFAEVGQGFVQNPGDVSITVGDPVTGSATIRVSGGSEIVASTSADPT